jgi:bifunctional non-homologous end joining protein LigD
MNSKAGDQDSLKDYRAKRDFGRTPEPQGGPQAPRDMPMFCVQKHRARQLHYDFRIEVNGVLRSWAIPKGPSLDPAEKRFAARTEDHPLEYGGFEGVIPPDNYGAGTVMLWDHGSWEHLGPSDDPAADLIAGKLDFNLHGRKLGGRYALVRMGGGGRPASARSRKTAGEGEKKGPPEGKDWLLLKKRDDAARPGSDIAAEADYSVKTGLSMEEISREEPAVWNPATRRLLEAASEAVRAPMPDEVAPMLATLVKAPPAGEDWLCELKHDGVRVIANRYRDHEPGQEEEPAGELERLSGVRLVSRRGRDQTALYPEIAEALKEIIADRAILDGEIVALDSEGRASFQRLQPRMAAAPREVERLRREVPVVAFFFDLLYLDGHDLRRMPIEKRKEVLTALLDGAPPVLLLSDHVIGQGGAFFELAREAGVEGIVAKRLGSSYIGRRSASWLKIKRTVEKEFVIGGFTAPQGSRPHFGALLIGLYDAEGGLGYVTRVGSGFDDAMLASLYRELERRELEVAPFIEPPAIRDTRWVSPELVCRVRFAEWTNDGGLRAPVFEGLVGDLAPGDCRMPAPGGAEDEGEAAEEEEAPKAPGSRQSQLVDLREERRQARLANPDKVLFPDDGIVKRDIFEYFRTVAPILLPHLADRPLSLQRWPDGIAAPYFFQKDAPDVIPPFVRTEPIAGEDGKRTIRYIIADNEETLLWLANLTAFTLHPWGSRVGPLAGQSHRLHPPSLGLARGLAREPGLHDLRPGSEGGAVRACPQGRPRAQGAPRRDRPPRLPEDHRFERTPYLCAP